MAPITEKLDRLSSLADSLNAETDALNAIIEALEQRLASMKIGVAVELDGLCAAKRPTYTYNTDGMRELKVINGWQLGYSKLGDTWRITAIRGHEEVSVSDAELEKTDTYHRADWEFVADDEEPVPLVRAPRIVRVEAADRLEELVSAIITKAEGYLASITKAKTFATK